MTTEEKRAIHAAHQRKYSQSEWGREKIRVYRATPEARALHVARQGKYERTHRGRATKQRWVDSEKGITSKFKSDIRHNANRRGGAE